ncbi:hypothetical protein [Enterovibrio norvegicus]|uniref:hypothetical protein n=1 Tax=Enterovibrio norvegicus TaxID=188144 RepID=UPI0024B06BCF|nr:hypothetical protein [Enterovibrio norvegicus]
MKKPEHREDLVLTLKIGIEHLVNFDFNRFRFLSAPGKRQLENAEFAYRDVQVERWFNVIAESQELRDKTKHGYAIDLARYLAFVDSKGLEPESEKAAHAWEKHLVEKVRLGSIRTNTAQKLNSSIKCLLKLLEHPVEQWFSPFGLFRSEVLPTTAYSDEELKLLLRLIYPLFNQLYRQIIKSPELHLFAQPRDFTAEVELKGKRIEVAGTATKCFTLGYFLMSYFTWANATTLLSMQKFKHENLTKNLVYSQSVLKSRANKYVTISIGDNNVQHVPKHALKFIEKLLKLSNEIAPESEHLFFRVGRGKFTALEQYHLRDTTNWMLEHFNQIDDYGKPLRPMAKRFRASGSARFLDLTGDAVGTASLLGNTPQTLSRHYTKGSPIENQKQLQAATYTLEAVARCSDISESKNYAKKQLDVEVLPYEAFLNKYSESNKHPQTTVIGSGCKDPFGREAEQYRRKMNFSPKDLEVDHLACSDILKCFSCHNQVIVEEVDDIWCLMSFKQSIDDSLADHIDSSQFERNFRDLLEKLDLAIFKVEP